MNSLQCKPASLSRLLLVTAAHKEVGAYFAETTQVDVSNAMGAPSMRLKTPISLRAWTRASYGILALGKFEIVSMVDLSKETSNMGYTSSNIPNMQTLTFLPSSLTFVILSFNPVTISSSRIGYSSMMDSQAIGVVSERDSSVFSQAP
jgi:hypothetical protein